MKRLITLFLVLGVLGVYSQTTEGEIQSEADIKQQADTTQNADTIKINEQENEDTSVIRENIDSMDVLEKSDDDSLITIKKNPWLYDWRYGCLIDGLTYLIPIIIYYTPLVDSQLYFSYYPLNDCVTPYIYPVGLVFAEKIIKSIILTENRELLKSEKEIKIFAQTGFGLPYYARLFIQNEFAPFPELVEFSHLINDMGINYVSPIKIWNNNIFVALNFYTFPDKNSPVFVSTGLGLVINNYNVSVEKVVLGKYNEIPSVGYQWFVENNYIVNYKFDFWGISLGWGKKFNIWKGFYVEPRLQYKFIYTKDFKSGSIVGIMGGLSIGYKF